MLVLPSMLPREPLLLASASPRRREILAALRVPCVVVPVEVDESRRGQEAPGAYLERVVASKLVAALALPEARSACAVLGADTIVVHAGRLLGKPADRREAREMLRSLAGEEHEVSTRFALAARSGRSVEQTVTARVVFRGASDAEIDAYVATGECDDKAGAYAAQGVGGFLVRRIEGSYSAVVGLPVCELCEAFVTVGIAERFPLGT